MGLPSLRGECLLVAFLLHAFFGVAVDLASMFDYGNQLYKNGSLIEATKVYRNVLSVEENHTEALCNLGTTFVDLNRIDEAVPLFQKALQRASPHINAFSGMGVIKMKQGKLEESLRFFFHAAVICSVERTLSTSGVIQYEQTMANLGLVLRSIASKDRAAEIASEFGVSSIDYRVYFQQALHVVFDQINKYKRMQLDMGFSLQACKLKFFFPKDWHRAPAAAVVKALHRGGERYGRGTKHMGDRLSRMMRFSPVVGEERGIVYFDRTVFLAQFKGVYIDGNAVGTIHDGCSVFLRQADMLPPTGFIFDRLHYSLPKPSSIAAGSGIVTVEFAMSPLSRWNDNYYHFLVEAVPRLILMLRHWRETNQPRVPYLIVQKGPAYVRELLELVLPGFQQAGAPFPILYLETEQIVHVKELWTVEWYGEDSAHEINMETASTRYGIVEARTYMHSLPFMRERREEEGARYSLVFISRFLHGRCGQYHVSTVEKRKRILSDHDEVVDIIANELSDQWRLTVEDGCRNMVETIRTFADSHVVCGVHGAGLSNLIFVREGAKAIEITPQEAAFRDYFHLAASLGIELWTVPIAAKGMQHGYEAGEVKVTKGLLKAVVRHAVQSVKV